MNIVFDTNFIAYAQLSEERLKSVVPKLLKQNENDTSEQLNIYSRAESQYRMLTWLGWQFNGIHILDVGVRSCTSAICLANNPANKVTGADVTDMFNQTDIRKVLTRSNIDFILGKANDIPIDVLKRSAIISLDISHNGQHEQAFLDLLDSIDYNGIVIMDDVTGSKFPRLRTVWYSITKPKILLPACISHYTGTGIVAYGPHTFSIV